MSRPDLFTFSAGQYMQVAVASVGTHDPRGRSRVFSISSSPNDTATLTFAFRRTGSGFKNALEQLPLGATVQLSGPYGHVTLTHESRRPRVLLASGIGITPHLSMIRFAAEENLPVPLTLLYMVPARERAAYVQEVEQYARTGESRFTLQLRIGSVSARDLSLAHDEHPDALWYLSGSPGRMATMLTTLRSIGVRENDLAVEEFVGY